MLNYWDYYGTTPSRSLCDVCHCHGHWSYECSFSPQYSTTSYNTQWEGPSFGQGYEDNRVSAYDQNFQNHEFYQPSQYQHVENENSVHDKLDMMIGILEEMRQGTRQMQEQNNEWFDQQMSQFYGPIEEIEEDEETLPFPAQYSSRPEGLCLPKQSLVVDEQNLEPEADCLRLPKQNPIPEPYKPIYTEQDYALEFDDFSEVDETELLVREHEEIDSTRENKEVEMSNKEIEEATNCLQSVKKFLSIEPMDDLTNENLIDIPLSQPTITFSEPEWIEQSGYPNLWHRDDFNPTRKGWDSRLEDVSLEIYKTGGDLIRKSSHGLVFWEFYPLPFKIKDTSDWNMVMETHKCEDETSNLLNFEDDRLDAPDIITWYKDRGKHFSSALHLYQMTASKV